MVGDDFVLVFEVRKKLVFKLIFIVVSGNFLEMFDFMVFGYYVMYIVKVFFLIGSEFVLFLLMFMMFGVGFFMWFVGVLVFGVYIDKYGWCWGLLLMFGFMVFGMFVIVVMLDYL